MHVPGLVGRWAGEALGTLTGAGDPYLGTLTGAGDLYLGPSLGQGTFPHLGTLTGVGDVHLGTLHMGRRIWGMKGLGTLHSVRGTWGWGVQVPCSCPGSGDLGTLHLESPREGPGGPPCPSHTGGWGSGLAQGPPG